MVEKEKSKRDREPSKLTFDLLRVTPEPPEDQKFYKSDRLTDFLIVLFIFGIAMWFRFVLRAIFIKTYGIYVFDIKIDESDPFGFGSFLGIAPGSVVNTEGYHDFYVYYIPYVKAYSEGWNPYTGGQVAGDHIGGYVYGPFYMISIAIGKLWFGMNATDSIVFSNIILDSLTYVMVYIILKKFTGNIIALIFALAGSFSPISFFYIAYRGLNAPIMNFSFMLFVYFYLEKRDNLSMFFLAFSILTKQFPLFMAMPVGFWMVRRYGFSKGVSYYLRFFIFLLVLSVPFILWTPIRYIFKLFLPGGGKAVMQCPSGAEAPNLFHGSLPYEACFNANGDEIPLQTQYLTPLHSILFGLVNSHILFFGSLILIAWIGFTGYHFLEERPRLYLVFIAAYYGLAHATIARGIYKYYITFLVPLFLMALVVGDRHKSLHLRLGYLLHRGWSTWINPRYRQKEATISFWLFFLVLVLATVGTFWLVFAAISMFTFNTNTKFLWQVLLIPVTLFVIIKPGPLPEEKKEEFVSTDGYLLQILSYVLVGIIGGVFLYKVAMRYFNSNTAFITNVAMILGISLIFSLIPLFSQIVTKKKNLWSPFTFNPLQLLMDGIGIFLVVQFMIFFNVQVLTINRLYPTLFLLLVSFIPMGLLGKDIWLSGIRVPMQWIYRYLEIKRYALNQTKSDEFNPKITL